MLFRSEGLAERGTIGIEQLDAARAAVDTTDARLRAARARLAELENGSRPERIAAQRGALGELDAGLDAIDVQIDKTVMRAPFAGTISARLVDEGAVVSLQMPAVAFHLVESGALEVRTGLPPKIADALSSGDLVPVLRARGAELAVRSTRILPTVDAATARVASIGCGSWRTSQRRGCPPDRPPRSEAPYPRAPKKYRGGPGAPDIKIGFLLIFY